MKVAKRRFGMTRWKGCQAQVFIDETIPLSPLCAGSAATYTICFCELIFAVTVQTVKGRFLTMNLGWL